MSPRRSDPPASPPLARPDYKRRLRALQEQLVKLQSHVIRKRQKLLVLIEGRDAAGKDGAIKRIAAHLSPRETRIVALAKPSEIDRASWYFQRYVAHLPVEGEIVLFNRSWYNRAGVERVMGFCTNGEFERFIADVPDFERLLVRSGILLRKYFLDIGKSEQRRRLAERSRDPLTQWKSSPIDAVALAHWTAYSEARDEMLARSHTRFAPWKVVRTDDKRSARINLIQDLLAGLEFRGKDERLLEADRDVVSSHALR